MRDLFIEEGTVIEAEGNSPFLLNNEENVWVVQSGMVDVFIVRTMDGKAVGSRSHLFRAETGHVLFGINLHDYEKEMELLASPGSGTRLLKLEKARLKYLATTGEHIKEIAALIDSWVSGLSSGIVTEMIPKDHKNLETGNEIIIEEGYSASPDKGVVWIKTLEGDVRFLGREAMLLETKSGFFPVSSQTWLHAVNENKLTITDTEGFLKEDPTWLSLNQFHKFAVNCIASNQKQAEGKERTRLENKTENDRFYMKTALSRLADILKIGPVKATSNDFDNTLFRACQRVGNAIGVEIKPHPDLIKGVKLKDPLRSILDASRVRYRSVILKDEWWETDIGGPVLAFVEKDKTPVAILPTAPGKYKMYNPVEDTETLVTSNIASSLSGTAHTFYRPFPDKKLSGLDLVKFGLQGMKTDIKMVALMGVLAGLLTMVTPIATGKIFDTIIPGAERGQLFQLSLALIIFACSTTMFQITRAVAMLRIEGKMDASIQAAVWDRLLNLPVPFFRIYSTGDLAQRAMGINLIRRTLSGAVVQSVLGLLAAFFSFMLLFYYSAKLAFVGFALVLLAITTSGILSYFKMSHQRVLSQIEGKISGMVLQFINGINKIRVANAESRVFSLWTKEFSEQKKARFKAESIANHLVVFNASFPLIATMVIFFALYHFNSNAIAEGDPPIMSTGDFLAFNAAFNAFLLALLGTTETLIASLNIIPYYERLKPIFETLPEVNVAKSDPGILSGNIQTDQIYFRYTKDGPIVLDRVCLNIKSGEYCALVGASGSGKSTLFRVLLGFETLSSGSIYYDSQDLSKLDVRSVRRQLGVVLQNGSIISGTFFTNIIGSLPLTLDDAWEAAKKVGLDQDIRDMPMGMHTVISEGAATLSGGQRQRLLIARAIVHKPRIIYFDEATSALDNKTQAIVSKSLDDLKVTRVVIAHRLSTIVNADRIYVLDRGKIVQEGSYEELINQKGLFADLAKRQIV